MYTRTKVALVLQGVALLAVPILSPKASRNNDVEHNTISALGAALIVTGDLLKCESAVLYEVSACLDQVGPDYLSGRLHAFSVHWRRFSKQR